MNLPVTVTIYWQSAVANETAFNAARDSFLSQFITDGKTDGKCTVVGVVPNAIIARFFVDLASANEYANWIRSVTSEYNLSYSNISVKSN